MRILGTMSGTSLDGVDAAVLLTDGEVIQEFGPSRYRPYRDDERSVIAAALGRWPGEAGVAAAGEVVENAHAEVIAEFPDFDAVELIGFHGQTLAHEPGGRGTHQTGDGALLAEVLERPVVWDFRSSDVALGGQGAPLAPFFHFACARWIEADAPLAFLNLGGVGNVTWVDIGRGAPDAPGACLAFDTGPANAPIDDLLLARRGLRCDERGELAAEGRVDEAVVEELLVRPYFYKIPPKSLDRNDFAYLSAAVAELSDADAAATLTVAAARAVIRGAEHFPAPVAGILVAGGGRHNATLMAAIQDGFDCPVVAVETVGLNGDMLEAQAFAFLAARVYRGLTTSAPGTTGVPAPVGGGRISRPAGARDRRG